MARPSDPAIIANALRFLVSGFKMASDKGVPAVVRRLNEPEEPRTVEAHCSVEAFQAGNFQCRLPHDFLLESIGSGENGCVLVGPEAKGAATFGGPAQDGSESYRLSRVSHAYREIRGQSFRLTIDMELGEPIPGTFVHRGPADPAGTVYRAILDVEFENLFKFLFPTTKSHGQVLAARIEKCFGLTLATPTFHVTR